jgi:hypothetical protein
MIIIDPVHLLPVRTKPTVAALGLLRYVGINHHKQIFTHSKQGRNIYPIMQLKTNKGEQR